MTGDLDRPHLRISNDDRERVIAHLQSCTAEGRLDLDEFSERVDAVYAARTAGDLVPITADLPELGGTGTPSPAAAASTVEIKATASSVKRRGRWHVPRTLRLAAKAGAMHLDLSHAVIPHTHIDVDLDLKAGSIKIVLPRHATADAYGVDLRASSLKNRAEASPQESGTGPLHFRFTGTLTASSVKIRRKWRFWRWEF